MSRKSRKSTQTEIASPGSDGLSARVAPLLERAFLAKYGHLANLNDLVEKLELFHDSTIMVKVSNNERAPVLIPIDKENPGFESAFEICTANLMQPFLSRMSPDQTLQTLTLTAQLLADEPPPQATETKLDALLSSISRCGADGAGPAHESKAFDRSKVNTPLLASNSCQPQAPKFSNVGMSCNLFKFLETVHLAEQRAKGNVVAPDHT
ncbi:MAG: hypothetical protein COB66_05120 [Coxiella sp. (in: Bacteria)]|nr:MAG: hypothetical protein COB66_05120 [Coxiella sp. (in: g-proteobacteria)]